MLMMTLVLNLMLMIW